MTGENILKTLIKLFAEQEGVTITYEIEKENDNVH